MTLFKYGNCLDSSDRFDRENFDQKMKSFEKLVQGEDTASNEFAVGTTTEDDILSLDDSIDESTAQDETKVSARNSYGGALEQTLMLSPTKRSKNFGQKSPMSAERRRGLARFLRNQSQTSSESNKKQAGSSGLDPIWQYSDIMSVAASLPARKHDTLVHASNDDEDDHRTIQSLLTYNPCTSTSSRTVSISTKAATSNQLWDRATKSISAARGKYESRSSIPSMPCLEANTITSKRSKSLDPAIRSSSRKPDQSNVQKSPRRKLKKKSIDRLSQSDHVAIGASLPRLSPPTRDSKNVRGHLPSMVSTGHHSTVRSTVNRDTEEQGSPQVNEKKKTKKKKSKSDLGCSSIMLGDCTRTKEVLISTPPITEHAEKKKKRSKSLSRLALYEHESVDTTKRDPSKRRAGRRESRSVIPASEQLCSSSPKPGSAGSHHGAIQKSRLSRRQLLKKMDSESVISAPPRSTSISRTSGRSASPRPGRNSSQMPRRGGSERNLVCSSLHKPNSTNVNLEPTDAPGAIVKSQLLTAASPTRLPRRGDSKRILGSESCCKLDISPPTSAQRRKVSTNSLAGLARCDRGEFVKMIDSVNSFFGKGHGEVGLAYSRAKDRKLATDEDVDNTQAKAEKDRRKNGSNRVLRSTSKMPQM